MLRYELKPQKMIAEFIQYCGGKQETHTYCFSRGLVFDGRFYEDYEVERSASDRTMHFVAHRHQPLGPFYSIRFHENDHNA